MRFRTINHNLIDSAIDNDWFLQEEIKRKNREEQKKLMQRKKEEPKSLAEQVVSPKDLLKNMSVKQQKILQTYAKTDLSIKRQQDRLNLSWKNTLTKQNALLKDKSWALNNMFENGFADKWNAKNKSLIDKRRKNLLRLHKII